MATAILIEGGKLIVVSPEVWRMPVRWGRHKGADALSVAFAEGIINLLQHEADQAPAIPIIALRDLALLFGARKPPPPPADVATPWAQWLLERRTLSTAPAHRAPSSRSRGRPATHDWDDFWITLLLRVGWNDLDGAAKARLAEDMKDWFAVHHPQPPDDRTIERKFERLAKAARSAPTVDNRQD